MTTADANCLVELRLARIPGPAGKVAAHYWLVTNREQQAPERWEIWQSSNVRGESWGHLHKNLKAPHDGVGNGPSWVEQSWRGGEAARIVEILDQAPRIYPACDVYWVWPGPNSNTFVQWVLRNAGQGHQLGPLGAGAAFSRLF